MLASTNKKRDTMNKKSALIEPRNEFAYNRGQKKFSSQAGLAPAIFFPTAESST